MPGTGAENGSGSQGSGCRERVPGTGAEAEAKGTGTGSGSQGEGQGSSERRDDGREHVREWRVPVMAGELPRSRRPTAGEPYGKGDQYTKGIPEGDGGVLSLVRQPGTEKIVLLSTEFFLPPGGETPQE